MTDWPRLASGAVAVAITLAFAAGMLLEHRTHVEPMTHELAVCEALVVDLTLATAEAHIAVLEADAAVLDALGRLVGDARR